MEQMIENVKKDTTDKYSDADIICGAKIEYLKRIQGSGDDALSSFYGTAMKKKSLDAQNEF